MSSLQALANLNNLVNVARRAAPPPPVPFKGLADELVVEIFFYLTKDSDLANFALSTRSVYKVWEENCDFIKEVHDQHFRATEKLGENVENRNMDGAAGRSSDSPQRVDMKNRGDVPGDQNESNKWLRLY